MIFTTKKYVSTLFGAIVFGIQHSRFGVWTQRDFNFSLSKKMKKGIFLTRNFFILQIFKKKAKEKMRMYV